MVKMKLYQNYLTSIFKIIVSKKLTNHNWQWYSDLALRQKTVTLHEVYTYIHICTTYITHIGSCYDHVPSTVSLGSVTS